ncbi:transcriptional regulator (plasmid) [Legionella adelaidensis]|uniref:Transcriptional regulator n=1 Tax=Legionella adelaidensis TaxID=45056 RepID=A0A0W0R524_9GAMM|nr:hypothetical protein [Legionella adelaidensis]KTC66133.1 transcriptional regulator [Legionella adelaidensis]VEH85645.1 transcriptional regulator [Legionella adelaidensis]
MKRISVALAFLIISGCVSPPPRNVDNLCSIFRQYPQWYKDAKDVERRWRVPVAVQMSIIHQESKFNGRAQPQRTKLLWIIPWTRPSTAYGYSQALSGTWAQYKKTNGHLFSARDRFGDGVDFIGWYANIAHQKAGISRSDAYNLYLAYHEGVGGYQRKTYLRKKWLLGVAHKVSARAQLYQGQLNKCKGEFSSSWFKLW